MEPWHHSPIRLYDIHIDITFTFSFTGDVEKCCSCKSYTVYNFVVNNSINLFCGQNLVSKFFFIIRNILSSGSYATSFQGLWRHFHISIHRLEFPRLPFLPVFSGLNIYSFGVQQKSYLFQCHLSCAGIDLRDLIIHPFSYYIPSTRIKFLNTFSSLHYEILLTYLLTYSMEQGPSWEAS